MSGRPALIIVFFAHQAAPYSSMSPPSLELLALGKSVQVFLEALSHLRLGSR